MKDGSDIFRGLNRQQMYQIWQYTKANDLDHLSEEEQLIGKFMLEYKDKKPEKIYPALGKELDFIVK